MSKLKFTPAPWTVDNYDIVATDDEGDVSLVATTVSADYTDAVNFANARLIAAAPELFNAAVKVLESTCANREYGVNECFPCGGWLCPFVDLRNAVNKAKKR